MSADLENTQVADEIPVDLTRDEIKALYQSNTQALGIIVHLNARLT
jgi:hypothetical protein